MHTSCLFQNSSDILYNYPCLEDAVVLEPPGGVHLVLVLGDREETNVTILILVIRVHIMLVLEVEQKVVQRYALESVSHYKIFNSNKTKVF